MNARFTARARQVMQLANREAQRLNHEYIGTEHLLLGLLREGGGVGCDVLRGTNIDLDRARREVLAIVQSGPDMITLGPLFMTPRAEKVIAYATGEAARQQREEVSTGDLLLGLVREQEGVAAQVLLNLGVLAYDGHNDLRSRVDAEQQRMQDDNLLRPPVREGRELYPNGPPLGRAVIWATIICLGVAAGTWTFLPVEWALGLAAVVWVPLVIALFFWRVYSDTLGPHAFPSQMYPTDREALLRILEEDIAAKFGPIDENRRQQIRQWDVDRLIEAAGRLDEAKTLDDLM